LGKNGNVEVPTVAYDKKATGEGGQKRSSMGVLVVGLGWGVFPSRVKRKKVGTFLLSREKRESATETQQ